MILPSISLHRTREAHEVPLRSPFSDRGNEGATPVDALPRETWEPPHPLPTPNAALRLAPRAQAPSCDGEAPAARGFLPRLAAHIGLIAATTLLPTAAGAAAAAVAAPPLTAAPPVAALVAPAPAVSAPTESRPRSLLEPSSARYSDALDLALRRVPRPVIDAVRSRETRIWVVPHGARHVPAALLHEDGQPLADVARDWRRWQAAPTDVHGLMSMPDHRAAFVSPDGDVTVPDLMTGHAVSYGRIATLRDLAARWGASLYGTDPASLPTDLKALESLLAVMNPHVSSSAATLPAGIELRLPVSVPYQGRAYSLATMALVAEVNARLADGEAVSHLPFSGLLAVREDALASSKADAVVEGIGRMMTRIIDEDPRYGFEHATAIAVLASDAEASGRIDTTLGDPAAFYARAFAETYRPDHGAPPRVGDAATWAEAKALVARDVQWLAGRQARPPALPDTGTGNEGGESPKAPRTCAANPGPQSPVRTEMLDAATLRDRYARNSEILSHMTDPASWSRHGDAIVRDLGIVPPGLLEEAQRAGLRIFILPQGETQVPAHLFPEDAVEPAPEARTVQVERAPFVINPIDASTAPPRAGQTLADIARARGATTPAEVDLFVTRAALFNDLPAAAPLASGQTLRLPDVHFYQGRRYSGETMQDIALMNQATGGSAGFFRFWEDGRIAPVLMVKEQHLCEHTEQASQKRILLHEMGHVAEYLALRDPQTRDAHQQAMTDIRASAARTPSEMLTTYSRVHPAEQYADAFEAWFTADRPGLPVTPEQANDAALRQANPRLRSLIESELERYTR